MDRSASAIGSSAIVKLPLRIVTANVSEVLAGTNAVWKGGKFVPGMPGITGGRASKEGGVVLLAKAGSYKLRCA